MERLYQVWFKLERLSYECSVPLEVSLVTIVKERVQVLYQQKEEQGEDEVED